ncbi:MAG: hypothetical protein NXI32_28930 [bacterium]|nr:hypothetical protein [bacterium]
MKTQPHHWRCRSYSALSSLSLILVLSNISFSQTGSEGSLRSSAKPDLGQVESTENRLPAHFANATLALGGYCPVTIVDQKKWVKGSADFAVVLDGKTYHMPDKQRQQDFLKDTTKYTPALSGDCVVSFRDSQQRQPGELTLAALHQGRLYLFASAQHKQRFMAAPDDYADVDLAFAGLCTVCYVDVQQNVPGKPEHGTVVGGLRYYFSDAEHRKQFLRDKARYVLPTLRSSVDALPAP